jgi:hypothetical protein
MPNNRLLEDFLVGCSKTVSLWILKDAIKTRLKLRYHKKNFFAKKDSYLKPTLCKKVKQFQRRKET